MKQRKAPLSIILSNIDKINTYANIKKQTTIINDILPGKYTLLFEAKKHNLSKLIQNDSKLIGIRIPNHKFTINLVKSLQTPIITTSINVHGQKPLIDLDEIERTYPIMKIFYDKKKLDSKGSTILDLSKNKIHVVREGDAKIIK